MKSLMRSALMLLLVGMAALACNFSRPFAQATPTLVLPTPPTPSPVAGLEEAQTPSFTPPATIAPPPTPTLIQVAPTVTSQPTPTRVATGVATPVALLPTPNVPGPVTYQVAYVLPDDMLNVRQGPGVENEVAGKLPPAQANVQVTEGRALVSSSRWVTVDYQGLSGWVNDLYLTETVSPEAFCADPAARAVVDAFSQQVLARGSGPQWEALLDSQRGLRLRLNWWNPEVWLRGTEATRPFESTASYDWGVAMGSGAPVAGSVNKVLLPLLDDVLQGEVEVGCSEILHGPTAGVVKLPEAYAGINYFSLYRPAPADGVEFDWGTWVVGVEKWQGRYIIAFLINYRWEI